MPREKTGIRKNPIGIFDSGVGGLSVFKAVRRMLPQENLLYYGDTAHFPYGSKSKEAVCAFSMKIAKFLTEKRIKLLVVACNTASSLALEALRKGLKIPVLGVIEPGAHSAARQWRGGLVGVIGTEATIESRAYPKAIGKINSKIPTVSLACPLFAPLVEDGWWNKQATALIAGETLKPLKRKNLDSLILGCTHYPFLKPVLQKVMGAKVPLIDSAEAASRDVHTALIAMNLKNTDSGPGYNRFYASDAPKRFVKLAKRFGVKVNHVEIRRFD